MGENERAYSEYLEDNKEYSFTEQFQKTTVIICTYTLLIIVTFIVIKYVGLRTGRIVTAFINFVTCGGGDMTSKALDHKNICDTTYSDAKKRKGNLMKGLESYNIFENPSYQKAFGLTGEEAKEHKHVDSIRNMRAIAQEEERKNEERRSRRNHDIGHGDDIVTAQVVRAPPPPPPGNYRQMK